MKKMVVVILLLMIIFLSACGKTGIFLEELKQTQVGYTVDGNGNDFKGIGLTIKEIGEMYREELGYYEKDFKWKAQIIDNRIYEVTYKGKGHKIEFTVYDNKKFMYTPIYGVTGDRKELLNKILK